jgi:hypothetical protein
MAAIGNGAAAKGVLSLHGSAWCDVLAAEHQVGT